MKSEYPFSPWMYVNKEQEETNNLNGFTITKITILYIL